MNCSRLQYQDVDAFYEDPTSSYLSKNYKISYNIAMKLIDNKKFPDERDLYGASDIYLYKCIMMKEAKKMEIEGILYIFLFCH